MKFLRKGIMKMEKIIDYNYKNESKILCPKSTASQTLPHYQDTRDILRKNLINFRKERHLSQKQIAKILGISYQQIQKYENGKNRISAETLYQLSRFYHICLEKFFII